MNTKRYSLSFLPLFEKDLNGIVDYITHRLENPIVAEHFVDEVERAIYHTWRKTPCFSYGDISHTLLPPLTGYRLALDGEQ